MTITEIDEKFMREALAEARAAAAVGEVPIGAVVVRDGEIVARAHNRRELDQDPSAHAEFAALCTAAQALGRWRLSDCTVYVTLEPCCMCAGLMVNARVGRCVYGASDAKAGALGSLYDLNADSRLNHRFHVTAGVLADECRAVLSNYFAGLRGADGVGCGCGANLEAHVAHAEALADGEDLAGETLDFGPVQRRPRRVLLAIDSFKGSVSSAQAEEVVAEGVRRVWPDAQVSALPLADGGEGTLDAVAACGGEIVTCEVAGPLGKCVAARMLVDGEHESAVIEMAEAAGIGCSPCTESAALAATTYGVGELMLRAVRAGARTLYMGLGGSATNDGGAGMLQALGARLVDDRGCNIALGLTGLEHVASIDLAPALRALNGARVVVLSDVENPLVGRRGALAVFGGQKGLPTDDVEALGGYDDWMVGYGRLLDTAIAEARAQGLLRVPEGARTFGSVLGVPGAGAAGGLGAALLALGAELHSGVETVLDLIGFDERVRDVDLVITGEGNMDEQSAAGKAPVGVARRAKRYGKPVVAVVGGRADNLDAVYGQGIDLVLPICRKPMDLEQALDPQEATTNLICAGEAVARSYDLGRL
ncbi:tRNA adenosine(34) deaminase TadA [Collinsella sp. AM13-34]|uniref:tRNA adenosine(34) deaminase TadA n=1 Tax=Collinsella sp. AM13-34 TaxID=2292024 RepID=UPI000E4E5D66|nr:tRNA adenosine(34) deaminase TadA [Collinsella sp. AM13-34]RHI82590.1 glycerate kinase [Collinsella sp. AM13-34]